MIYCLIILGVILIDQITKIIAKKYFITKDIKIIKDNFYLTYLENSGGAMGKFNGSFWVLFIATLLSIAIYIYLSFVIDINQNTFFGISLSILIGGTFGNFIDRFLKGYVIDFIGFRFFKKNSPIFNIADFAIFYGMISVLISLIIYEVK